MFETRSTSLQVQMGPTLKAILNRFGVDITRTKNVPALTLLGLASAPIQTIIDVGANCGQFAKAMVKVFPNAQIHCFEPLPGPFRELQAWASTQGGRVTAINAAVGTDCADVTMNLHADHTPSSSRLHTTGVAQRLYPQTSAQRQIVVAQTTLDQTFASRTLPGQILIKLDTQGYEDRVIAGGRDLFARAHACITEVSLDILYEGQATFAALVAQLGSLDYQYRGNIEQIYGTDGHCIYLDALFIRRPVPK